MKKYIWFKKDTVLLLTNFELKHKTMVTDLF